VTVFSSSDGSVRWHGAQRAQVTKFYDAGYFRVQFEPWQEGSNEVVESWTALKASKWNKDSQLAWRCDLDKCPSMARAVKRGRGS